LSSSRSHSSRIARVLKWILLALIIVILVAAAITLACYGIVSTQGSAQVVNVPVSTYADITNPKSTGGPTTEQLKSLPHADYAVIPGAAVWGDAPSPVLQERIEVGMRLYKDGVVSQLFLSGGGTGISNEPSQMEHYLITHGVPKSALRIDNAGVDTYASLVRANAYYGPDKSMYFITEPAYANRAGYLLHGLGCNGKVFAGNIYNFVVQYDDAVHEYLAATKACAQMVLDVGRENVPTLAQLPVNMAQ
jgi:SanA protein